MTQEERDALDARVLSIVASGKPVSSYATACEVERRLTAVGAPPIDHEVVNRSLQRLRKRGLIEAKRHGSQSRWNRTDKAVDAEPPSTPSSTNMDYARAVEAHGALDVAITISKAISLLDVSKTARSASGDEMGDAYLNDARTMLLGLIGIEVES